MIKILNIPNNIGHYNLMNHEIIDSTQLEARRLLAASGTIEPTIINAKEQTHGYGQHQRKWDSAGNRNLTFTTVFNYKDGTPRFDLKMQHLPYLVAVSIGSVIAEYKSDILLSQQLQYKWTNDLLIEGRKCGGILIEILENVMLMGIGINTFDKPILGNNNLGIIKSACALADVGVEVNNDRFMREILERIKKNYDEYLVNGFRAIKLVWMKNAAFFGRKIKLEQLDGGIYDGTFVDIDDDGAIVLKNVTKKDVNKKEEENMDMCKVYYGTIVEVE